MKLPFAYLMSQIKTNALRKVIIAGLSANKDNYKNIKRNIPRGLIKVRGFQSHTTVPFTNAKALAKPVEQMDLFKKPDLANLLLKGWYSSNPELAAEVQKQLKAKDYEVIEPDFNGFQFTVDALNEVDIQKNENGIFFHPGGVQIDGFDDEEVTIMAALLGWIVLTKEQLEEIQVDDEQMKEQLEEIQVDDEQTEEQPLEEPSNTNTDNADKPSSAAVKAKKDQQDESNNQIDNLFRQIEQDFADHTEAFNSIRDKLEQQIIPDMALLNDKIIALNAGLQELAEKLEYPGPEKVNDLNMLKDFYNKKLEAENVKAEEDKNQVKCVLAKVLQILVISGETPECITKIHSLANELLVQLEKDGCEAIDWYAMILNGNHFLNKILLAIETSVNQPENEDEIDQRVDDFHEALNAYDDSLYIPLSRLIYRNKLVFDDDRQPKPPKDKKSEKKTEDPAKESQEEQTSDDSEQKDTQASAVLKPAKDIEPETKEKKLKQDVRQVAETPEDSPAIELSEKISKTAAPGRGKTKTDAVKKDVDQIVAPLFNSSAAEDAKYKGFRHEDINIIKLLEHNETYLAYHLAVCYENKGMELIVPSGLLENLALSPVLLTGTGQAAGIIAKNNEKINLEFDEKHKGYFRHHLAFAALLRPAIFAFNTSLSGFLLNDVRLGKHSQFEAVRNRIFEFMTQQGQEITTETIKRVIAKRGYSEEKQEFRDSLKTWMRQALHYNFNTPNHAFSQVFHNMNKQGGLIYKALMSFLETGQVEHLKNLLNDFLNDGEWESAVNAQLWEIVNNATIISNRRARTWISNHLSNLKNMLVEGVALYEEEDSVEYNLPAETREFISFLTSQMNAIKQDMDWNANNDVLESISSAYLAKAVDNLLETLSGNEKWVRPDLLQMKYRPLLNIRFYDAQSDWSPKAYDDDLAQSISEYAGKLPVGLLDIMRTHILYGNYEAYNRILYFESLEGFENKSEADQKDLIDKLGHEVNKAKLKIEKGCAYGFITNGKRSVLFSLLEKAKYDRSNSYDGLNYPLKELILSKIEKEIDGEKAQAISRHEKDIASVTDKNTQKLLYDTLKDGNIIVFNDTLIRTENVHVADTESEPDYFNRYFNTYLKNCNGVDLAKLLDAIENRKNYAGIPFGDIPDLMIDEVKTTCQQWFTLKNNRNKTFFQEFDNYKDILTALGFIDPKCTSQLAESRLVYFDFDCIALLGRNNTPLPAFGSLANGKYRLVCITRNLNEDDLVLAIKQAMPQNDRAVVVFNFLWMDIASRLEVFKLCKQQKLNFLLLDEAMMIYQMGLSESRFPVFIKIAAPFSYKMPYQRGASNIPEEMFYGRKDEIEKLKNKTDNFSCLIYGGRQLGKTVLQKEIVRQFHSPKDNHFAVYVDLRNYGIGGYRPIDDIIEILLENFKDIPGIIPEKLASNIGLDTFLGKLEQWFRENDERRLILLLDEADQLVDQDARADWKTIFPMKRLMDKTERRFKIVLSGLHDVRRTMNIPNNPLAHFGIPICIGPMLDNDESKEARLLVKLPLQALGYEFESEELVLLILSHCNWYPSLIQEFCTNLVDVLIEKRQVKKLPVIINERDVTTAYEKSRRPIRDKFMLTLSLDERYKLLANVVAELTLDDPETNAKGQSVANIMEVALICWKEGFDNANPKIDIRNLLFEMSDLGILRAIKEEHFALRTPSLLEIIGSRSQIVEYLYNTKKALPSEFKRDLSRILYKENSDEEGREKMSPFPASYFDMIISDDNKALLIRGNQLSGIDSVAEFLSSKKSNFVYRIESNGTSMAEQFSQALLAMDGSRAHNKKRIVLFESNLDVGYPEIRSFKHKVERREKIILIFLMKPESFWKQFSNDAKYFELIENLGVPVVNMPLWKKSVARDWFMETNCNTVNVNDLFKKTGAWHFFVDKYHESISSTPELWEEKLIEMEDSIRKNKDTHLMQFGILDDTMLKQVAFLCEYGSDKMTLDEYAQLNGVESDQSQCHLHIQYFRALNIIDQGFIVDGVIKNLINHG